MVVRMVEMAVEVAMFTFEATIITGHFFTCVTNVTSLQVTEVMVQNAVHMAQMGKIVILMYLLVPLPTMQKQVSTFVMLPKTDK